MTDATFKNGDTTTFKNGDVATFETADAPHVLTDDRVWLQGHKLPPGVKPTGPVELVAPEMPMYYWPMWASGANGPHSIGVESYDHRTNSSGADYFNRANLHTYYADEMPPLQQNGDLYFDGVKTCCYSTQVTKPSRNFPQEIERTMVCTFKILNDDASVQRGIMGFLNVWGGDVKNYGVGIAYDDGTLVAIGNNNSTRYITTSFNDNDWHTVGARFSSDGALFLDGKKMGSGDTSGGYDYSMQFGTAVGNNLGGYNAGLHGYIRQAACWEIGLSDEELAAWTSNPYQFLKPAGVDQQIITTAPTADDRVWLI